jgi:soluble lytic murein transglycosylase-like protein
MDEPERRMGIVEELELLARRARFLLLGLPVLLLLGLGTGKLLGSVLSVRDGQPARLATAEAPPAQFRLGSLSWRMQRALLAGDTTAHYVSVYRDEIAPIEHVLRRRGVPSEVARRVAWPLAAHASDAGVDPATVISVMLIESAGNPDATSSVGARGLMQVMPSWTGYWRQCGRDLYDVEDNLCYGTKILAYFLERHRGDERKALLGYNGCVRGTVTPTCGQYPDKVDRVRRQVRSEMANARRTALPVTADGQ